MSQTKLVGCRKGRIHLLRLEGTCTFSDCKPFEVKAIEQEYKSNNSLIVENSVVTVRSGYCGAVTLKGNTELTIDTLKIVTGDVYAITQDNATDKRFQCATLICNKPTNPLVVNVIAKPVIIYDEHLI